MRMSERIPQVETHIRPSRSRHDRIWVLEITCPFCGKGHTHGGGAIDRPPLLGHRVAHCVTRPAPRGGYELILADEEPRS
jgi:hypothetical protein